MVLRDEMKHPWVFLTIKEAHIYLIFQHHTRQQIDIRTSILKIVVNIYRTIKMCEMSFFAGKTDTEGQNGVVGL